MRRLLLAFLLCLPLYAADTKISDLSADATVSGTEEVPVADSGSTLKATVTQIRDGSHNLGTSGVLLEIPNATTLTATDCDEASEAGRIFMDTDATSGQQIYGCEGTSGWVQQGDGDSGASALIDDTANALQDAIRVSADATTREQRETGVTIDSSDNVTIPGTLTSGVSGTPTAFTGVTDDVLNGAPGSANEFTWQVERATGYMSLHHNGEANADKFIRLEDHTETLQIPFDGGGSAITADSDNTTRRWVEVPWNCTITSYAITADQSGSLTVDLWVDTYANWPPTDADSITAAAPVTISTANKATDATLTGWTTSLTKGDWVMANVDSATTITNATLSLRCTRTE